MGQKQIPMNNLRTAFYCRVAIRRIWLYCRVADDDALALEMQEQRLKDYAAKQRWNVVGVSRDRQSGTSLFRPGLMELNQAVAAGKVDSVLVVNLCRLCRSTDDAIQYGNFLKKHGVTLYSMDGGKVDLSGHKAIYEAFEAAAHL